MAIETELKFTVEDRAFFSRIISLKEIAGYRTINKGLLKITDICFDTRDNRLYKEKIVFRLRVTEHKSALTFKTNKEAAGSAYQRIEIESKTTATVEDITIGKLPDLPPVNALIEKLGHVDLFPSLTVENNRHIMLLTHHNTPYYELVLDDVTFTGPRGTAKVCELEVESLFDTENDLENIGAWIKSQFGLQMAGPSKFILGMNLVGNV